MDSLYVQIIKPIRTNYSVSQVGEYGWIVSSSINNRYDRHQVRTRHGDFAVEENQLRFVTEEEYLISQIMES